MSDGISPSPVPTTQPSTSTEVAEQGQPPEEAPPTEEEPLKDLPHVPSNQTGQIVDEKGTTAGEGSVDQSADRPAETTGAKDMDADMDLGEGTSNPAPDERSGSDPVPSTKEPKSAFIKIMELGEKDMLKAYLEAFFDHFRHYKISGGELHGNISIDTIIYLEEPKKGGLLHLDPPIRMSRDFNPCPRQRWIPELEYDEDGEVIFWSSGEHVEEDPSSIPIDWYMKRSGAH